MSREIKFRAWDKREKRMWHDVQDAYDWQAMSESNGGAGVPASTFGAILKDENFIVMEFTGLHDKNGKEIFEGDIVQNECGEIASVIYDTECGILGGFTRSYKSIPKGSFESVSVIGDIHSNPELLKN